MKIISTEKKSVFETRGEVTVKFSQPFFYGGFLVLFLGVLLDLFEASGPSPSGAASDVAPCALVTQAELDEILGKVKSQPSPGLNPEAKVCEYLGDGGERAEITLDSAEKWEFAKALFPQKTTVSGLGDEAFANQTKHGVFL